MHALWTRPMRVLAAVMLMAASAAPAAADEPLHSGVEGRVGGDAHIAGGHIALADPMKIT